MAPGLVMAQVAPSPPALQFPEEAVSNGEVGFSWSPVTTWDGQPATYILEVSASATMSPLILTKNVGTPTGYILSAAERLIPREYYWRVVARDSGGRSTSSTVRVFSVLVPAIRYKLEVATDPAVASGFVLVKPDINSVAYQMAANEALPEQDEYYWRITATDPAGNARLSTIWKLRMVDVYPPTLAAITYPPTNGEKLLQTQPYFIWATSTDANGPVEYRLEISVVTSFLSTEYDSGWFQGTNRQVAAVLQAGRDLYARVSTRDNRGNVGIGPVRTFQVQPLTVFYDLFVSGEDGSSMTRLDISTTNYVTLPFEAFKENVQYSWTVTARDLAGNSRAIAVPWKFKLGDTYPPLAPAAIYPVAGAAVLNPQLGFSWSSSTDATNFVLTIADDSSFTAPLINVNVANPGGSTLAGYALADHAQTLGRGARYFWKVRALDAGGNGIDSPTFTFTVPVRRVRYRLDLARDDVFNDRFLTQADIATTDYTLRPSQQLEDGVQVYWRVVATDEAENEQLATPATGFKFKLSDIYAPPPPVLEYPADNATLINAAAGFTWNTVSDVSPPITYTIQVSSEADFSSLLAERSTTGAGYRWLPGDPVLPRGTRLYWRIRVTDSATPPNTAVGAARSFTIAPRVTKYDFVLSESPTLVPPHRQRTDLTATSYAISVAEALAEGRNYYWSVTATDEALNTTQANAGGVFKIRISDVFPPSVPVLMHPQQDVLVISNRPGFVWQPSYDPSETEENRIRYRLEVSFAQTFATTVLVADNLVTAGYTMLPGDADLQRDRLYYWRVQARDVSGNAVWSPIGVFSVKGRVNTYKYVLSTSDTLTPPKVLHELLPTPTYTLASEEMLSEGTPYYWDVWATDEAGNEAKSVNGRFKLGLADNFAPVLPALEYPLDNATLINPAPCFRWAQTSDPNGVTYRIEVSSSLLFDPMLSSADGLVNPNTGYCIPPADAGKFLKGRRYYWRVQVKDSEQNAAYTPAQSFVIDASACKYTFELSESGTMNPMVLRQDEITGLEYTAPVSAQLQEGRTYYWMVTAIDPAGHQNPCCETPFRFKLADRFPPSEPTILFPRDDQIIINARPTFVWEGGDDPSPVTFGIQVARNSNFIDPVINVPATSLTVRGYTVPAGQDLIRDVPYFWRVMVLDSEGNKLFGQTHAFRVANNAPTYELSLRSETSQVAKWFNLTSPSYSMRQEESSLLTEGVKYYWSVVATDPAGNSRTAPPPPQEFSFRLADVFPPLLPELLYPPPDGVVLNRKVGFVWSAVTDPSGVRYSLQVSETDTFEPVLFSSMDLIIPDPSLTGFVLPINLDRDKTYHWRVVVKDTLGNVGATPSQSFTVSADKVRYLLDIQPDIGFSAPAVYQRDITDVTYTLAAEQALTDSVRYRWNVTAQDPAGNSVQSTQEWHIYLADVYPPPEPEVVYPRPNATIINPRVGFVWEDVFDAAGVTYTLQISTKTNFSTILYQAVDLAIASHQLPLANALAPGRYYWRVNVKDGLGYSRTGTRYTLDIKAREFTYLLELFKKLDPQSYDVPALKATVANVTGSLPVSYTVQDHEQLIEDTYLWRVTATDEAKNSALSAQTFTLRLSDVFPPPKPVLLYPADGVTVINPMVAYTWTKVVDTGEPTIPVNYCVQVASNAAFLPVRMEHCNLTQPQYQPFFAERLGAGAKYYWRVTATDSLGHSITSNTASFTVAAPQVVYSLVIAKADVGGGCPMSDVVYRTLEDLPTSTHALPPAYALNDGITYCWHVTALDPARNPRESETFKLRLADVYPPESPVLTYPRDTEVVINDQVGFVWEAVADHTPVEYMLQVTNDRTKWTAPANVGDPGLVISSAWSSATRYASTEFEKLERGKTHFWRVMARDDSGNVSTSVMCGEDRTPRAYCAFGVGPNAVSYTLEITDVENTWVSPYRQYAALQDISKTIPLNDNLPMNKDFWWRVVAKDVLERTTASNQVWKFNIKTLPFVQTGGLLANYFDGTEFDIPALMRIDPQINFPAVADGNPLGDFDTGIGGDSFSVRWQGWVRVDQTADFTFFGSADDGQRLWVNGVKLIDYWAASGLTQRQGNITLAASEGIPTWYSLQYEFFENLGQAQAVLEWRNNADHPAREVIPSDHLAIISDPADRIPPQILDYYIVAAGPNSVTVHVSSDKLVIVTIAYGPTAAYGNTITTPSTNLEHDILITNNVQPGEFHYKITLLDLANNRTVTEDIVGCTPLVSQITAGSIRAVVHRGIALAPSEKVLETADTSIDLTGPIGTLASNFSVRWDGMFMAENTADHNHTFFVTSDDGQRLFVDGLRRINDWVTHTATQRQVALPLSASWHPFRYEYFQGSDVVNSAKAEYQTSATARVVIPGARFGRLAPEFYAPRIGTADQVGPIEATGPAGTPVTVSTPSVMDCRDPRPVLSGNAPETYPLGSNIVTWTATNRFGEAATKEQVVVVRDTTPPALEAGPNLNVACNAPLGDGRTPGSVVRGYLNVPTISDIADPSPTWSDDVPDLLALGPTTVTVTARDASGNRSTDTYIVNMVDSGGIYVNAGADITVPRMYNCDLPSGGTNNGTLVTMHIPVARGQCWAEQGITLTHNYPEATAPNTNLTVCVPDNETTIVWTARSSGGAEGTDSIKIRAITVDFLISFTAAPTTWVNGAATVRAQAVDTTTGTPIPLVAVSQWIPQTSEPASSITVNDVEGSAVMVFEREALYCPFSVYVLDGAGRQGAGIQPCFGIDKTRPTSDMGDLMATAFVDKDNPTIVVPVVPTDRATFPHYFWGDDLDLSVRRATDIYGPVSSGVKDVLVEWLDIDASVYTTLGDSTFAVVGGVDPATGPTSGDFTSCTVPARCPGNRLDLGASGRGYFAVKVTVHDVAGNAGGDTYFLRVVGMKEGMAAASHWVTGTPQGGAPKSYMVDAARNYSAAADLHYESPGHSLLQAQLGYDKMLMALDDGYDIQFLSRYLPAMVKSETRRIIEYSAWRHSQGQPDFQDWNILGTDNSPLYLTSRRLTPPYLVDVDSVLADAMDRVDAADQAFRTPEYTVVMAEARSAYEFLSVLFQDKTYASLFGYTVRPEAFFRNGTRTRDNLGKDIAASVRSRIVRMQTDPAYRNLLPPAARPNLDATTVSLQDFANGVGRLAALDPTFDNHAMMSDVYLKAQKAFDQLNQIRDQAFDTNDWRMGMALTLGYAMNFSMYEGPTAMRRLVVTQPAPTPLPDTILDAAECRFDRVMHAIQVGDVSTARCIYQNSKCLMVELYNKYYGGGQQIPGKDACIDPADATMGLSCPRKPSAETHPGGCLMVDQAWSAAAECGAIPPDCF